MKQWVADVIASPKKAALPVLSFPSVQLMGITVKELISAGEIQARGLKLVADRVPMAASVSLMDLSVEAEAFGSTVRVSDDEVPTVIGAIVSDEDEAAGADGVLLAEPLTGLLSPALAREFSHPYVKELIAAVQSDDFAVFYHNCGNTVPQMAEDVYGLGTMGYHFGNCIDMASVMDAAPAGVLVMGNVDPAGELRNGTPDSVRAATRRVMEACSRYPNVVISSGCDIPPLTPWENIDAFFGAVEEFYAS